MDWLECWRPGIEHALLGAAGGLISSLGRHGDVLPLPAVVIRNGRKGLYLGFFSGVLIGAFVGYLVDRHPVISGAAGYLGIKGLDYLIHRLLPGYGEKEAKIDAELSAEKIAGSE